MTIIQKTFFAFVLMSAINISCSKKEKISEPEIKSDVVTNDLPVMSLTMLDGSQHQAKTLSGSVIIILFQTDCDHCQREAKAIQENLKAFQNYSLYFVTSATTAELEAFARQYKLDDFENVHFAITDVQAILDNYGSVSTPSVYVYNTLGKLVTKFNGETDINEIMRAI